MMNFIKKSAFKSLVILTPVLWLFISAISHAGESIQYLHHDGLGSTVAATDEAGELLWREAYRPYGERIIKEDNGENDIWYTGKQHSETTGLTYFGARYYLPDVGRFTAIDPVGFRENNIQSFNRYAYVNNNPYKYIDPDGEYLDLAVEAVSIGVGIDSFNSNYNAGNYGAATVDGLGVLGDGILAVVPGVPGAIGLGIKTGREGGELISKGASKKLSKINKEKRTEPIGNGKFTKTTKVIPGEGPGQSRAEMEFVKNSDGKVIRSRKFSYDRGNKLQHKKDARGGPEGRPANGD